MNDVNAPKKSMQPSKSLVLSKVTQQKSETQKNGCRKIRVAFKCLLILLLLIGVNYKWWMIKVVWCILRCGVGWSDCPVSYLELIIVIVVRLI